MIAGEAPVGSWPRSEISFDRVNRGMSCLYPSNHSPGQSYSNATWSSYLPLSGSESEYSSCTGGVQMRSVRDEPIDG